MKAAKLTQGSEVVVWEGGVRFPRETNYVTNVLLYGESWLEEFEELAVLLRSVFDEVAVQRLFFLCPRIVGENREMWRSIARD